jgi:hypothetical protein
VTFETASILLLSLLVVLVIVLVVLTFRVLHRAGDEDKRPLPPPIAGGAVGHELVEVHTRLDDVMTTLAVIREDILRRPAGALPLGTAPPKEHRPQFVLTSEERNNKVLRRIYTCRVEGCPDTLIDEEPEPTLARGA